MDSSATLLLEVQRRLSPLKRLEIMAEMCDAMRAMVQAGIRERHPDWSPQEVCHELLRLYDALPPGK